MTNLHAQGEKGSGKNYLKRDYGYAIFTIADEGHLTTEYFKFSEWAGGSMKIIEPDGSTLVATKIGFYVLGLGDPTGEASPLKKTDNSGYLVAGEDTNLSKDEWIPLPAELFTIVGDIKLWSTDGEGANIAQTSGPVKILLEVKG